MVTLLLSVGFNPNVEEGCGATPLVLAVIGNKPEICRTLVQHLADIDGPFFVRVPSPKQLATHLGYNHILEIFGTAKVDKKDETVWSSIYGQTAALSSENGKDDNANETEISEMLQGLDCSEHKEFQYSRETTPTLMIGDNATTRIFDQPDGTITLPTSGCQNHLVISIAQVTWRNALPRPRDQEGSIML